MFELKAPCSNCPFRSDKKFHLGKGRAREIADALLDDKSFHCHKTVDYSQEEYDDDGEPIERPANPDEKNCAGAAIILEKMERPNQMMRICERIGMYDRHQLEMDAPVYDSLEDWVASQETD